MRFEGEGYYFALDGNTESDGGEEKKEDGYCSKG